MLIRDEANPLLLRRRLPLALLASLMLSVPALATVVEDETPGLASAPLAERGPAPDGPLFERLSASRTGIDFVHRFSSNEDHLYVLANAMAGGAVALGDYDGDGLADVYLTRPEGGGRLYRNLGDMRFEASTAIVDDAWSTGATFADVDDDGHLDLYVCGYDNANRLWMNRGDGTFVERAADFGLDYRGASITMAFADYDLDGDLDGYLLTNRITTKERPDRPVPRENGRMVVPEDLADQYAVLQRPDGRDVMIAAGQRDRLYRNDGGTFTDVTEAAGITGQEFGLSVTWWDYDDDGDPDLYVANDFFGADHLYRNDGDGTFTDVAPEALPHTPWFSMGSDTADIDNDDDLDYIASDMSGTSHFKQKANMGEMNEVGWFLESPVPRQYMRNALYVNTGTGRFLEAAYMAGVDSTDWTWSTRFGDLDNDGWVDLFVSNGMTRNFFNSDLRLRANQSPESYMEDVWLEQEPLRETNLAFRNLSGLRFEPAEEAWGLDHFGVSFGASLGDLDGDGDLDLVVNDFESPVGIWRNRSADGHLVQVRLEGTASNRFGLGARVRATTSAGTRMAYNTTTRGFMSCSPAGVHFGLGADETLARLVVEWPSGHAQTFRDLPADRLYTITEPGGAAPAPRGPPPPQPMFLSSSGTPRFERPFDDFARQPLLPYRLSQLGPGLAVADVDGDVDLDYFLGGPAGSAGLLFRNQDFRGYAPETQPAFVADADHEDMAPLFLDFDSDGDLDLYVVSGGIECEPEDELLRDRLYVNDGKGNFTPAPEGTLPDLRDSGSVAAAADFDLDGDLDVFVGSRSIPGEYPLTPISRLLKNEGGTFSDVALITATGLQGTGLVTGAVWSDADGDGLLDLLVTHEWGPVGLWYNRQGRLVNMSRAAGLTEYLGWWNGIAARDIDNDGDMDYVVTNAGLNTKYHASVDQPTLLFYGDYDGSGTPRLVEAEYEDEELFPVRGRSCSSAAMPFVAQKFESFESFAMATVEDVYTKKCLVEAQRFQANTLASGVFINNGKARFEFRPLPDIVQISPSFGAALTEIDGDGVTDLYVVQNFFAPQRETGRMDGGVSQLLLGKGDGTFEPVEPRDSGLLVPGDGKSLALTDFNGDGWVDMLVGVNNGPLRGFFNRGSPGKGIVSVRLLAGPGNPTAVGSRVTVELPDGTRQTAEVQAGSGYLSQSSTTLAFGLGSFEQASKIEVRWPNGAKSTHRPDGPGRSITIRQQ